MKAIMLDNLGCSPERKADVFTPISFLTVTVQNKASASVLGFLKALLIQVNFLCHYFLTNLSWAVNFPNYVQIQLFCSECTDLVYYASKKAHKPDTKMIHTLHIHEKKKSFSFFFLQLEY